MRQATRKGKDKMTTDNQQQNDNQKVSKEGITITFHCVKRNFWDMSQGEYCRQPAGHDGPCVWEW
tara:strand:- start:4486 stop:4680 length:195 start_codon:yes stop_codon:yes gene_type:complete